MRDETKRFFASYNSLIPMQTGDDLKHGYPFVFDKKINHDVIDCLLEVCNEIEIKFGTQRDKDSFIEELTREAVESFVLWTNTYSDFDISTPAGRDEFSAHLFGEAIVLAREYAYDEEEQEQMRARDEQWENEDYITEKDLNVLNSFSRELEF